MKSTNAGRVVLRDLREGEGRRDRRDRGRAVGRQGGLGGNRRGERSQQLVVGSGVYRSDDAGGNFTNVGLAGSRPIARIVVHPTDPEDGMGRRDGRPVDAGQRPRPLQDDRRRRVVEREFSARRRRTTTASAAATSSIDPVELRTCSTRRSTRGAGRRGRSRSARRSRTGRTSAASSSRSTAARTWSKLDVGAAERDGTDRPCGLREESEDRLRSRAVGSRRRDGLGGAREERAACSARTTPAQSFTRVNPLNPRPFYFSQIRVDPENDKRVYVLGYLVHVSDDGGKIVPRGRASRRSTPTATRS